MHQFDSSLKAGEAGERVVYDALLTAGYSVIATSMEYQLDPHHIDAFVTNPSGNEFAVETTTDEESSRFGNVFFEYCHIDCDTNVRAGKYFVSEAAWHLVYLPHRSEVLLFEAERLQQRLREWFGRYRLGAAPNRDYQTLGLKVPIDVARKVADGIRAIPSWAKVNP